MPDICSMFCVPFGGWKNKRVAPKHGCDLVSIYQSHFGSKSGIYQTPRMPQVLGSHSFPFLRSLLTYNQLYFNCIKNSQQKNSPTFAVNWIPHRWKPSILFYKQRVVTILGLVAFYKHPHFCMSKYRTLL